MFNRRQPAPALFNTSWREEPLVQLIHYVKSITDLARQFNLRHTIAITPQTAHKWLTGQVIPTNDKVTTLAKWLGVTEHWLHMGRYLKA